MFTGGSAARHATLVACPRSSPIFNTQWRRQLQQASHRRRSLLHWFAARLCRVKRYRYHHDSVNLAAPVAGSTGDNRHGSASSGIAKPTAAGTGGNRDALGGQCNGSDGTRNGSTSRMGNAETDGSSLVIDACRVNRGGGGGHGGTWGPVASAAVEAVQTSPYGEADLGAPPASGVGGSETWGAAIGRGRVWQLRRKSRLSDFSARVGSSSRVRYAI